uniref:Cytochrome P450 n=1 Tax=Lotharella globosa TaxID=91324 RepID=A0A7S3YZM3_9EUKA|mmetsp:Transcript_15692/g.31896  ORF Transcript_15692/g.31896 Transcript_15692/m.31896 type:complete len:664 (+) Transcript_15692:32-2023(+)
MLTLLTTALLAASHASPRTTSLTRSLRRLTGVRQPCSARRMSGFPGLQVPGGRRFVPLRAVEADVRPVHHTGPPAETLAAAAMQKDSSVDSGVVREIAKDTLVDELRSLQQTTMRLTERLDKTEKALAEYQAIIGVDELKERLERLDELERVETGKKDAESKWYKGNVNLGEVGRLWLGQSEIPVAVYKPIDIGELFGGALFLVLQRFKELYGPAYLLPTGPTSSFLVLSDPASAKHVLNSYGTYEKGLVREISEFLFGDGFAVADGEKWKIRRRAVAPSLHKKYLNTMVSRVFASCSQRTVEVLRKNPPAEEINMEKVFSELTLDIIGKAVFNYDFNSVSSKEENPVITAVYDALKETETRSVDFLPLWKLPENIAQTVSPRQQRATAAVDLIRRTTEDLIANCKQQLEAEEAARGEAEEFNEDDYLSEADPSVLRFLIASREEVTSSQLRDDLLSMLVAGHETTGSVLTWTLYLLVQHPEKMAKLQEEIDTKLGSKLEDGINDLTIDDMLSLNYLRWCVAESMRLYPHPPVLIRRAIEDDVLPSGWKVPKGQDVMISIYNIHHSTSVWKDPDSFVPERWSTYTAPRDNPNERNTNYHYIPFSGGARKCIGDQFALVEAYTAMATLLYNFDFELVAGQDIKMTTGATIHTTNGMKMTCVPRR